MSASLDSLHQFEISNLTPLSVEFTIVVRNWSRTEIWVQPFSFDISMRSSRNSCVIFLFSLLSFSHSLSPFSPLTSSLSPYHKNHFSFQLNYLHSKNNHFRLIKSVTFISIFWIFLKWTDKGIWLTPLGLKWSDFEISKMQAKSWIRQIMRSFYRFYLSSFLSLTFFTLFSLLLPVISNLQKMCPPLPILVGLRMGPHRFHFERGWEIAFGRERTKRD